jgi:hypothetical protein
MSIAEPCKDADGDWFCTVSGPERGRHVNIMGVTSKQATKLAIKVATVHLLLWARKQPDP